MKKLLLFILLLFYFLIPRNVFASDLDVSCSVSFCALSAHDAVFSQDTKWTPGKTESREVLIKNTDSVNKEIFIRARNYDTSTKELDSYMNITLYDGSYSIWEGTLADFINAGDIKIVNLSGGNEFNLQIEAEMASFIPNDMQGKSSVFNFSFGFVGDNSQSQNSTNSNDSGSDSSGSSDSSSGEISNTTTLDSDSDEDEGVFTTALGRLLGAFAQGNAAPEAAVEEKINVEKKEVLGAGENICKENYLWLFVLIAQLLFSFILFVKRFEKRLKLIISGHTILFAVSVMAIYLLSCVLWPILISIFVFAIPLIWLLYKNRKSNRS